MRIVIIMYFLRISCSNTLMYVCICNALKECDLRKVCKNQKFNDAESLINHTGCSFQCGQCIDYIEDSFIAFDSKDDSSRPSDFS